jgi:glucose-1-phosphate adenylyltransferase
MAGGKGSRLVPLTSHRAKPAVPFGGRYRIIDFVLSNFLNSGYRRIYVLTQYMASSLIKHIQRNWNLGGIDGYIELAPAQMRLGEHWYRGTADAVLQNLNLIRDARADLVAVFGGDHVYKFDVSQMEEQHRDTGAVLTVAAIPVPLEEGKRFGVIQVDGSGRIVGFQEKPEDPIPIPGKPYLCLASMGNYLFDAKVLEEALIADANDPDSIHDFGKNIIPKLVADGADVRIYDFATNRIGGDPHRRRGAAYWRDVGTVDSYMAANMDVRSILPHLNLYNRRWRIRSAQRDYPPARFVQEPGGGATEIYESLVCEGCIVSSGRVRESVLGYDCFIHKRAEVSDSILLSGCNVGAGAIVRKALLDKNCNIAPAARIGVDIENDRSRFPFITPAGIVALPKGTNVPAEGPIEFAGDMMFMIRNDPVAMKLLEAFEGEYTVGEHHRHSYQSAGPRYQKYRPV